MFILEPIFDYRIWGGSRLSEVYGEKAHNLAHLYSVYGKRSNSNKIINGTFAGQDLETIFDSCKEKWGLAEYDQFPLTIALVDASDDLSIQVHPDDEVAMKIEHTCGKRESWYFLAPPSRGYIYNGVELVCTDFLGEILNNNEIVEVVSRVKVTEGDYVYIRPGTVHAMTAGSFVYEIEEGSDLTYRLYDYNRIDSDGNKRDLHIDKGLQAVNADMSSIPIRYSVDQWLFEKTYASRVLENILNYRNDGDTIECITLLDPETDIGGIAVKKGMSILLEPRETITNVSIGKCIAAKML